MNSQPAPRFVRGLKANLTYWQKQTEALTDEIIRDITPDHGNMLRAIKMGLVLPATQPDAARLATQLYRFIERGGFWTAWPQVLERAVACLPPTEVTLRFQLLVLWGRLLRYDRDLETAVVLHLQALDLAKTLDDPLALGEVHYCLSADYRLQHAYVLAETHGQQALALFEAASATFQIMEVMNTLGIIAFQRGDLETAVQLQHQAVALARQNSTTPTLTARFLTNLGGTLDEKSQHAEALTCLEEAGILLEPTSSVLDKIRCANQRGTIYFHLERFHDAEHIFRYVMKLLNKQPGALYLKAVVHNNLGNVLYRLNQLDEAEVLLRQSIRLWEKIGDEIQFANSLSALAGLLANQGSLDQAKTLYHEAITLLDRYPENILARRFKTDCLVELKTLQEQI